MADTPVAVNNDPTQWAETETIGVSGLKHSAGFIYEEFLRKLEGRKANEVYQQMRENSAIIGAVFYVFTSLLRQVNFTATAPEDAKGNALADEAAALVNDEIKRLPQTWSGFLSEVMTMFTYGWALFELTFGRRPDGRVGLTELGFRSQDTLDRWDIADDGTIRGMVQNAPPRWRRVHLPMAKCALFRTEVVKNNPQGRSLLRNAYRSWHFQTLLEEIEAIGMERDLAGLPVLEVPPHLLENDSTVLTAAQTALKNDLYRMVRQLRRNEREGIVIPSEELPLAMGGGASGYRLRLLASGGARALDVSGAIRRHQTDIAMTMLGEFIMLGTAPAGSYALSSDKTDMFSLALGAWLDIICDTFTSQVINPLMRLNGFPQEVWPTLTHEDIETPPLSEIANYVSTLAGIGALHIDPEMENKLRKWATLGPLPLDGSATLAPAAQPQAPNEVPQAEVQKSWRDLFNRR